MRKSIKSLTFATRRDAYFERSYNRRQAVLTARRLAYEVPRLRAAPQYIYALDDGSATFIHRSTKSLAALKTHIKKHHNKTGATSCIFEVDNCHNAFRETAAWVKTLTDSQCGQRCVVKSRSFSEVCRQLHELARNHRHECEPKKRKIYVIVSDSSESESESENESIDLICKRFRPISREWEVLVGASTQDQVTLDDINRYVGQGYNLVSKHPIRGDMYRVQWGRSWIVSDFVGGSIQDVPVVKHRADNVFDP